VEYSSPSSTLTPSSSPPARILIVDDDPLIRRQLEALFAQHAYTVSSAANGAEALARLRQGDFSLAVVDLRMPDRDGITLTTEIRGGWPETDVIIITGHGSIKDAVDAMTRGACDFITKPFETAELLKATQKALERRLLLRDNEHLRDDNAYLRRELSNRHSFANMVTCTPAMSSVFSTLEMLATNDVTVVITGESGTGKELAARAVHFQGKRRDGRFVAINCAAVPEPLLESELFGYERGAFTGAVQDRVGKIELANGGTLFLDEVETIPLAMQAKLLRVLEERAIERLGSNRRISVDMRVVCATNRDLGEAVAAGEMREDFYYRINVVPVRLPPLRQRLADLRVLAADYLGKSPIAQERGVRELSPEALAKMSAYPWPGNIRELRNVLERALLTAVGDVIEDVDLPGGDGKPAAPSEGFDFQLPLRDFLKAAEKEYLVRMLAEYRGSIAPAARHAVIDQATLHRKIRLHKLRPGEFRRNGRSDGEARE
jgi:two-component system response regulator AtoC